MMDQKRNELIAYIWDAYKDAHGIRPRHINFDVFSTDDLELMAAEVSQDVAEAIQREAEHARRALAEFEAQVRAAIELGANNRHTALRWLTQSQVFHNEQCIEHWVWEQGILFTDEGRALVQELKDILEFTEWG